MPFLRCAEFGREIVSFDQPQLEETDTIRLGKVFHMHREEDTEIRLNKKNLTSHTFITGSTGSGKSNTVYQLLNGLTDNLTSKDVHFLVIEPAKGEYKNVFGHKEGVSVYGTNPAVSKVLHINPFSFPEGIHILEDLDRLIEIFNVCWPMYAAMPAVLKEAVEKSYEDAGWNLAKSENEYETNFYPSFADVARNIRTIIDTSEYDAENKGAYKGSLVTRLASLTNGLNGQIFTSTEEDDINAIFNENTIVDLSRVGSAETKSLIMGLLVLKLQEYRMSSNKQMNSELKHITVLEEAHNLLKRTSTEQSMESSNLAGKSVEMLTNAIAEMRTYGEGFIIADQAPALLDMAVIRNTNTKIIMRLPDQSDRELVGKAANLNDEQITELSRLPCGVAAVYQNEWIQPVLCKIDKYDSKEKAYLKPDDSKDIEEDLKKRGCIIDKLLNKTEVKLDDLSGIKTSGSIKASILNYQKTYRKYPLSLGRIFSELIPEGSKKMEELIASQTDVSEWKDVLQEVIIPYSIESKNLNKVIQSIITESMYRDINHRQILLDTFTNYCKGGEVMNEFHTGNEIKPNTSSEIKQQPREWLDIPSKSDEKSEKISPWLDIPSKKNSEDVLKEKSNPWLDTPSKEKPNIEKTDVAKTSEVKENKNFELDKIRHDKTPVNDGEWSGDRGNSNWNPDDNYVPGKNNPDGKTWKDIKEKYNIDSIPFENDEPDFSELSKGEVEIDDYTDDRDANFDQADEKLAEQRGCTPEEVYEWRNDKEHRYTWHELNDCKTMQKVPSDVHGNVSHAGGISTYKNQNAI